MALAEVIN